MGIRIFAGGYLASTERHGREIPVTDNAEDAAEAARAEAVFAQLGDAHGTRAQTALRFGLACPEISTIVLGLAEGRHLTEALQAVEAGPAAGGGHRESAGGLGRRSGLPELIGRSVFGPPTFVEASWRTYLLR